MIKPILLYGVKIGIDIDLLKGQFDIFGGEQKKVQKPGSRGGKFWIDDKGNVRYDARPTGAKKKFKQEKQEKLQSRYKELMEKKKQSGPGKEVEAPHFKTKEDMNDWYVALSESDQEKYKQHYIDELQRLQKEELENLMQTVSSENREYLKDLGYTEDQIDRMSEETEMAIVDKHLKAEQVSIKPDGSYKVIEVEAKTKAEAEEKRDYGFDYEVHSTAENGKPLLIKLKDGRLVGVGSQGKLVIDKIGTENVKVAFGKTNLTASSWSKKGLGQNEFNQIKEYLENEKTIEKKEKEKAKTTSQGIMSPKKGDIFYHFTQGIKATNGNSLIAYQHVRTEADVYSKREGGLVSGWESDHERTEKCATCGRKIVHIFWIKTKSGKIKPYGREHVHEALGRKKELTEKESRNLITQLENRQIQENARLKELINRAHKDKSQANYRFSRAYLGSTDFLNRSVMMKNDKGEYVRVVSENDITLLLGKGFKIDSINPKAVLPEGIDEPAKNKAVVKKDYNRIRNYSLNQDLKPKELGRLNAQLDKKFNFQDIGVRTYRQLLNEGYFNAKRISTPYFNRRHYNRLDAEGQKIYEEKLEKKKVYELYHTDEKEGHMFEVPKVIFDAVTFQQNRIKAEKSHLSDQELLKSYRLVKQPVIINLSRLKNGEY